MSAAEFVPAGATMDKLRKAAATCTGCELYRGTTQTVFSKGPVGARLVFVGEQPGDIEDRRGERRSSALPASFWTRRSRRSGWTPPTSTRPMP